MAFLIYEHLNRVPSKKIKFSGTCTTIPIIIDNGNYECRAGYSHLEEPHITFPNVVYRPRMSKGVLVGNDIQDLDSVRHSLKSPFVDNLVVNLDVQEQVISHVFGKLNVQEPLANPVVINEVLCNPGVCRSQLTELLFETYNVPKLMFYVDCLASYYNFQRSENTDPNANCLLISFGYQRTHIVPIIAFRNTDTPLVLNPLIQAARRLHTGGAHASWMIQRLLQLKYPSHSERITAGLAERLAHSYCWLASNYRQEMVEWKSDEFRRSHTVKVQLPFTKPSTEDLKALADRKRAQTERLLSVHRKRQQKQFESTQQRLDNLTKVENLMKQGDSPIVKQILSNLGLSNATDLSHEINACHKIMEKLQIQLNPSKIESTSSIEKIEANSYGNDNQNGNDEKESICFDSVDESQEDGKFKSSYSYLLEMMNAVYTNSFNTVTNELTGRYKRAAELLISQSLPSAVQTQMSLNTSSSDCKFTEAKLRHLWLNSLRDRRVYVSKKRAQRQSRVDLATQIGLHTNDQFDIGSDPDNFTIQSRSTLGTQPGISANNSGRNGLSSDSTNPGIYRPDDDKYDDSKKVLTERRRMQLEKIRAMAAELKPSRGRSRGNGRGIRPGAASRGSLKPRGRCRSLRTENDSRVSPLETNAVAYENDTLDDENSDLLVFDESVEMEQINSSNSLNRLWDPDADENTNEDSSLSIVTKKTNVISDYRTDNTGDESENERDQLAVIDSLLALYDPEASKDLGVTDLRVDLDQFYQIHVDTELMRSHEVLFQPSFMGSSEAGLSDCLEFVLRDTSRLLDSSSEPNFPQRIYLTGGVAAIPGLVDRIRCDIRPLLPVGSKWDNIEVIVAANPHLDAWHGARHFANSSYAEQYYTTKQMYEEYGPYYFKDHPLGNRYWINTN
ncbi:unnamed protein product [Schistosoma rodhaini]|uniref:Actin-related protein 5 n=3 Tax=Schistosoma rodhaini TaxID=6188 RepID=A0AA85F1E7_9TREM|nr:unnamed protein product [Schistosoma rodhaini]